MLGELHMHHDNVIVEAPTDAPTSGLSNIDIRCNFYSCQDHRSGRELVDVVRDLGVRCTVGLEHAWRTRPLVATCHHQLTTAEVKADFTFC